MLKKLTTFLAISVLIASAASCNKPTPDDPVKPDPVTPGPVTPDPDDPGDKEEPLSKDFLSAKETIAHMGAGWNLGNTFDAHSGDTTNMWIEGWGPSGISDYEKAWGQVPAKKELFQMMREAGFRSIRIPITWYPHMGTRFNIEIVNGQPLWKPSVNPIGYTVDAQWMARIKEVVDYVLAADMYCIINVHHDTGTANTHWVVASEESYAENCERFKGLWKQIAETFKDYDGRLLFESFNEMTDAADSWCFASYATPAHYDAAVAASAYNAVNAYAQDFVDVVRATGGNNTSRNLVVNTYAAACGDGNWNAHLKDPLKEMKLPSDTAKDHLMFQVHYYPTFSNIQEGKKSVDELIAGLEANLTCKGAPVIIGEWGSGGDAANKKVCYEFARNTYLQYATYFVQQAKAHGMATFYWMGISDGQDRDVPKFTQPDLKDAIIAGTK